MSRTLPAAHPHRTAPEAEPTVETPLDAPRRWVEFTDPGEPGQRFRCDLTWLTSDYHCLFGAGCRGIDAAFPEAGCCTLGAHFTDADDLARVRAVVEDLDADDWQLAGLSQGPDGWWEESQDEPGDDRDGGDAAGDEDGDDGPELKTRVVEGACILFNRPDHPGGAGCALHRHALRHGTPPHAAKPDVCWQLPIRRAYRTVTLPDNSSYLEVTIGEYDRRGWGPGGHDLDWYCTGSPLAHTGRQPLYASAAAELRELMGAAAYAELARHCEAMLAAVAPIRRAEGGIEPAGRVLLPLLVHPATLLARDGAATGDLGPS